MLSLLRALERIAKVDCVLFGGCADLRGTPFEDEHRILDVIPRPDPAQNRLAGALLRRVESGRRDWIASFLPFMDRWYRARPPEAARFAALDPGSYDLVFSVRVHPVWWFGCDGPRTVVDLDDVQYLSAGESAAGSILKRALKAWQVRNLARAERRVIRSVARAFVCSEDDAARVGLPNVLVLPNIVPDRGQFHETPTAGDSDTMVFVGALTYTPNVDGVEWFVNRVLPRVRSERPATRLVVVGKTPPGRTFPWSRAPGVEFVGTVDDPGEFIRRGALLVCPILYGCGTRIKILEALSYARPVVSTTKGAYGNPLGEESGLFRRDDPESTAEACLELLRDPEWRMTLGRVGRAAVAEHFGQERVDRVVRDCVASVLRRDASDAFPAGVERPKEDAPQTLHERR